MPYNANLMLINALLTLIMVFISKPQITYFNPKANNVRKGTIIFFILYILHCIFAFWAADTYHIWDTFLRKEYSGYEEIYNWLAEDVAKGNHFLWRTLVWTPACLFLYFTGKKLDLMTRNFLLAFVLLDLFIVSNTRGSLGHSMLLFGAVLAVDGRNKKINRLIGLAFVCASYYFHKSMYVNIIFAILALYPFGRKGITISLLAFPFLIMFADFIINSIATGDINATLGEGVGGVGDRTLLYVEGAKREASFNGKLFDIIRQLPVYITLIYLYRRIVLKNIKVERVFLYLFRLSFICIYVGALFAFVDTSSWISIRFRLMGMFPLPFVLARVWKEEQKSNFWTKFIILGSLFSIFINYILKYNGWSS